MSMPLSNCQMMIWTDCYTYKMISEQLLKCCTEFQAEQLIQYKILTNVQGTFRKKKMETETKKPDNHKQSTPKV
jgi:hypothetical protein